MLSGTDNIRGASSGMRGNRSMFGLGTLINTGAIILGGMAGLLIGRLLKERHQNSLIAACGVSTMFIAIAAFL